jgi:hypothetical protein
VMQQQLPLMALSLVGVWLAAWGADNGML